MVKGDKIVIAGLFLVPFSGIFSAGVWDMQFKVMIGLLLLGAIYGISRISTKKYRLIIKSVIVLCVLQGVLVILQTQGLDPFFSSIKNRAQDLPFGFSGSPNQSGLFFAVTSPLVLVYAPWLLPLQLFALFMAKTTSAVIGAAIGMLFVARNKKLCMLAVALGVTLFLFKFESIGNEAVKERLRVYKHSIVSTYKGELSLLLPLKTEPVSYKLVKAKCNPWFGFGAGSFSRLSPHNQSTYFASNVPHRYFHAHNDYIEVFFEYGWLGLTFLCFIILNALHRFIRSHKSKLLMAVTGCILVSSSCRLWNLYSTHSN